MIKGQFPLLGKHCFKLFLFAPDEIFNLYLALRKIYIETKI
jgi:hypothetical protein